MSKVRGTNGWATRANGNHGQDGRCKRGGTRTPKQQAADRRRRKK